MGSWVWGGGPRNERFQYYVEYASGDSGASGGCDLCVAVGSGTVYRVARVSLSDRRSVCGKPPVCGKCVMW